MGLQQARSSHWLHILVPSCLLLPLPPPLSSSQLSVPPTPPQHTRTQVQTSAITTEGRAESGGIAPSAVLENLSTILVSASYNFMLISVNPKTHIPPVSPLCPLNLPRQSLTLCLGHLEIFWYRKRLSNVSLLSYPYSWDSSVLWLTTVNPVLYTGKIRAPQTKKHIKGTFGIISVT